MASNKVAVVNVKCRGVISPIVAAHLTNVIRRQLNNGSDYITYANG